MRSVCFLYAGGGTAAANGSRERDVLANDLVVIEGATMAEVRQRWQPYRQAQLMPKLVRYFDRWGCSYRKRPGLEYWQPGPLDLTPQLPEIRSPRGPWPYLVDEEHSGRLLDAVLACCQEHPHQAGVLLDDFQSVDWWGLTAEQRLVLYPGEDLSPHVWRLGQQRRMEQEEATLRWLLKRLGQRLVVNGSYRRFGPRLWEGLGEWCSPEELREQALQHDLVLVKGLKADGVSWAATSPGREASGGYPSGTSYRHVFADLLSIAAERELYVGLAYAERPAGGGSLLSVHRYTNPATWAEL